MNATAATRALNDAIKKWPGPHWTTETRQDWEISLMIYDYGDIARAIHQTTTWPTIGELTRLAAAYVLPTSAPGAPPEAWRGPQLPEFCTPQKAYAAFERGYLADCAHPTTHDRHGTQWPAREPTPGLLDRYWQTISRWNQGTQ